MVRFYCSLNERDRRRYAAIEAVKLGHGGIQYISDLLRCDRKTIARGMVELNAEQEPSTSRVRQSGGEDES